MKNPITEHTSVPLTPIQEGMRAASTARPWLYVEQIVCHFSQEQLDPEILGVAFSALASQNPALRTVVCAKGPGRPTQNYGAAHDVPVDVHDWSMLSDNNQDAQFAEFLRDDREKGCDASTFPGFRLSLIQTGSKSSKLVWTFSHAMLDGRSFAPLLTQALENYEIIKGGDLPNLAPNQTPDVFHRHCAELAKLDHTQGTAHFAQALEGWAGTAGLIESGAEPARKRTLDHVLSTDQTTALSDLAKATGVTVSTIFAAAWGIVSARFADRADTVFGMTLNGRHVVKDTSAAPGCFIVTVPLRVKIARHMTIGDVLGKLRQDQIALRPFEQTPLTSIRRVTDVPQGQPFLESTLMFETQTLDQQMKTRGGRWTNRRVELFEEDDVPLTIAAYQGDALRTTVEYDPNQVPAGEKLARYLTTFLTRLAQVTPETALADISMLHEHETTQLVTLSSVDQTPKVPTDCCATLFERRNAQMADCTALRIVGGNDITYDQLDRAANALAQKLINRGITRGSVVGICAQRNPSFIAAIFAVWKAGAAFVPMEPTYPTKTLTIMAEDSGAEIILTDATAPAFSTPMMPLTDAVFDQRTSAAPKRQEMANDRLAYILFTSGSTGRPKGVKVSHASLSAHANAATDLLDLTSKDRVLQFASLSFDVAIEEIVPTLLAGATLVLRTSEMSQSVSAFLDGCRAEDISVLNLPTGFWVALTDALESDQSTLPDNVRLVIVGGERVPLSVLRRWRAIVPNTRWLNGYGPTETTITCTGFEVGALDDNMHSIPIGTPLSHAHVWVTAADGSLAPEGSQGELCISGPAVSDGYVGTGRGGFQNHRLGPIKTRSYCTGDRVFWANGVLHFVGRMDRQIKLRGFRIDPNQIESILEARDDVARAYVAAPSFGKDTKQLVAWYSAANANEPPSHQDVLDDITKNLPAHMRPKAVQLAHWPQTKGGKIKVDDLPQPKDVQQTPDAKPQHLTPQIRALITLFEDVLAIKSVTAEVSFFDIGGDSLSLLRLLSLIESRFGTTLPVSQIYKDPTPRGISLLLETKHVDHSAVLPIQPNGQNTPLYAIHALGENQSFFRPLSAALGPEQPIFGITVGLRAADMPQTVEGFATFYRDQIMRHQPEGPISLAAVSTSSFITFEVAQQLLQAGRDVKSLIFLDASGPDGRPRKGRVGHRLAHVKQYMKQGKPYLEKLRAERRGEDVHAKALARVQAQDQAGNADQMLSVAEFVAISERAISDYTPAPYPRKITIFRADDPFDSEAVHASALGWKSVAAGGFDVIDVRGGHITMLSPPHVAGLAKRLRDVL